MANGIPKYKVKKAIQHTKRAVDPNTIFQAWWRLENRLELVFVDRMYTSLPMDTWDLIIQYTGVNKGKYVADYHDCDDFALQFKAACSRKLYVNGVAWVLDWSGGHSYNAFITHHGTDYQIKFIEPQTDQIVIQNDEQFKMEKGRAIW